MGSVRWSSGAFRLGKFRASTPWGKTNQGSLTDIYIQTYRCFGAEKKFPSSGCRMGCASAHGLEDREHSLPAPPDPLAWAGRTGQSLGSILSLSMNPVAFGSFLSLFVSQLLHMPLCHLASWALPMNGFTRW